jgi:hypothetical protein
MATMIDEQLARLRAHRNNIAAIAVLKTVLTDPERDFIERRLAEEHLAFEAMSADTLPQAFNVPLEVCSEDQAA